MSKRKLLLIILPLSLIIVVGSALGTYFYLKQGPDVSNWNEFKDDFYGYSIKYPKGWFIYPDEIHKPGYSTDITSFDLTNYNDQQNTGWPTAEGELSIHIAVDNMGDSENLNDWILKNPPIVGSVVSQKDMKVAGVNSIGQITSESGFMIFIPKGNQIFIIQVEPLESLEKTYVETFNSILSSFKFTK